MVLKCSENASTKRRALQIYCNIFYSMTRNCIPISFWFSVLQQAIFVWSISDLCCREQAVCWIAESGLCGHSAMLFWIALGDRFKGEMSESFQRFIRLCRASKKKKKKKNKLQKQPTKRRNDKTYRKIMTGMVLIPMILWNCIWDMLLCNTLIDYQAV